MGKTAVGVKAGWGLPVHGDNENMTLLARSAIITGATRGIGNGLVKRLSNQPPRLAMTYHGDEQAANELRAFCAESGVELLIEKLDVRDVEAIEPFVRRVAARFGTIDYLVNNVAIDIFKPVADVTLEEWPLSLSIILTAPFVFCKSVLPLMRQRKFGRIVNIGASSKDYQKGVKGLAPFSIHKAALTVLTKTLALEEIDNGITVNMVAPGSTMGAGTRPDEQRIPVAQIPIGRRVLVDEVVVAIMYFLADNASATTGQFISVNGGMST